MAQAKQTQWDQVAFGHSGPPKMRGSPRQEGAAAPPIPLLAPYWPSSRGGAVDADISPCPKVQLSWGRKV